MKITFLITFFVFLICSCSSQDKIPNLNWKEFVSEETGIKIKTPCEPTKSVKSFQEKPRPIRVFSFGCEIDSGNKFLFDLKEHMDEFDKNKISEQLKYFEESFSSKTMIDTFNLNTEDIKSVTGEDIKRNGFQARLSEVKFSNGNRIKHIAIINERGTYNAMVGISRKSHQSDEQFEKYYQNIANTFIESFQLR